jgi:hypothetical protein
MCMLFTDTASRYLYIYVPKAPAVSSRSMIAEGPEGGTKCLRVHMISHRCGKCHSVPESRRQAEAGERDVDVLPLCTPKMCTHRLSFLVKHQKALTAQISREFNLKVKVNLERKRVF